MVMFLESLNNTSSYALPDHSFVVTWLSLGQWSGLMFHVKHQRSPDFVLVVLVDDVDDLVDGVDDAVRQDLHVEGVLQVEEDDRVRVRRQSELLADVGEG
ncbi:hypothetical protein ACFV3F_03640 [Streptomyces sp. NPDC059717]|uniref:hypothetical protein n=1 Tax=Streptomyces sp. NPDC059717 TaxID=3346922 RepID=UPI0036A95407